MLRERFAADLKAAIKARQPQRVSTLRLISAAVKDRDIAVRSQDGAEDVPDEEIVTILSKMIRQRQESARAYQEGGRIDLAEQELQEIKIINEYLPRQLSEEEVREAIARAIADTGATSIRDMGRVMAELKARHNGRMNFAGANAAVKDAFC